MCVFCVYVWRLSGRDSLKPKQLTKMRLSATSNQLHVKVEMLWYSICMKRTFFTLPPLEHTHTPACINLCESSSQYHHYFTYIQFVLEAIYVHTGLIQYIKLHL